MTRASALGGGEGLLGGWLIGVLSGNRRQCGRPARLTVIVPRERPRNAGRRRWIGAAVGLCASLGCAGGPIPCRAPGQCDEAMECLANRCVPLHSDPVGAGLERVLLEPTQIAVVRSDGGSVDARLPATVTLGGPEEAAEKLLVRFAGEWSHLDVDSAFLVLAPAPRGEPSSASVTVGVSQLDAPFRSGLMREEPGSHGPRQAGLASTRPASVLRIDVTRLLLSLPRRDDRRHGFVVEASAGGQRGATYLTGATGSPPRLEVYGHRRSPPRAP